MIALTPDAAEELGRLLRNEEDALRLEVHKGGCAGWQYAMRIDRARAGDTVVETESGRILIDSESLPFLQDSVVDFSHDLSDSGFKITNPNAARSCGCGTSFEPSGGSSSGESGPVEESGACGS